MVVCAVKLCKNNTGKNIKPSEGISFHRFPTDEDQKEEWIRAIRREPTWAPGTHCRICSVHFDNSDFKISETGRRILHKDAVPTKNLYLEERSDVSKPRAKKIRKIKPSSCRKDEGLLACRACLDTDGALVELHESQMRDIMAQIVGIDVSPTDGLPQHLCSICTTLLVKCSDFKTRCHDANELLQQALTQGETITTSYLRTIDRRSHNLTLPFTIQRQPNFNQPLNTDAITDGMPNVLTDSIDRLTDVNEMGIGCVVLEPKQDGFDGDGCMAEVKEESDYCDIQPEISTDDENFDDFDSKPLIEHKMNKIDNHIDTNIDGSNIEREIEIDKKKRKKKKREERDVKNKKIKKDKLKEIIRNRKPRKTEEDYEKFSSEYSVDIIFLTREQQIEEVIARKETDNYKNSRFKCELCFKGFIGETAFRNHKAIHDPSVGSYECEACKFRFPKRYKLLHHLELHKMNFVCRLCGHTTKRPEKAMEHFKWHNGVMYPCHFCDRVFIKVTSQFSHMRKRHGSASCDICQEIFSGERGLLAHMQKAHKEAVKCEVCNVQFHTEMALNRHLDTAPGGCGSHVKACAECGENYPTEESLNDHKKMVHWREIKCENVKLKEIIRDRKPRKTEEDYEKFSSEYSVDIIFLTREQQMEEVIARKETDNYKNSRFKCELCFKGFIGETAFRNHKAIHDPSVGSYECEACKFRFPKRCKLLHHLELHKMSLVCRLCGHTSKLPSKAMEHFKWHNGVMYPCHFCDRVFIKVTSQFNHMRNFHGSASCDICQEIFSGEKGLSAHMQKAHKEAVKCEVCNVQFHTEMALNRHLDTAPGGCGSHLKACAKCGENYPTEESLNDHMKMVHWKEIKCEKCNANFENEKLYRMHRVIHKETRVSRPRDVRPKNSGTSGSGTSGSGISGSGTGGKQQRKVKRPSKIQKRTRMCEICGLTRETAAALRYHQRVHTGEKPHQCTLCPKSFRMQGALKIHMNTHTGARPFKCPHCPKTFKSRAQNYSHQLVHTKIRRYRCDLCDKTFQRKAHVKSHIKTVHMKIPRPPRARH